MIDFDFYRPGPEGGDPFEALNRLHQAPAIFWTPRHGGHWVATRGQDIRAILLDHERFSSRSAFIPTMDRPRAVPLEIDPPEHAAFRRLLLPAFAPSAIASWTQAARELAVELIEDLKTRGECEFIGDFAQQLPIIIFLRMCDLPLENRAQLVEWVNASLRPSSPEARVEARAGMDGFIRRVVAERRDGHGDDLISRCLTADIGGRRMTEVEGHGLISGLLGGGLDTVTASMGWVARFLAENPVHRRQLIDQPELIPAAVDELLRRFSVPNIARVIREDMDYGGVAMKAGEQIFLSACLHGLDPDQFDNPLEVDFRRAHARRHSVFSHGIHRCPGDRLALGELNVFIEEWLTRIPDFSVAPGRAPRLATGIVHAVLELPLAWAVEPAG